MADVILPICVVSFPPTGSANACTPPTSLNPDTTPSFSSAHPEPFHIIGENLTVVIPEAGSTSCIPTYQSAQGILMSTLTGVYHISPRLSPFRLESSTVEFHSPPTEKEDQVQNSRKPSRTKIGTETVTASHKSFWTPLLFLGTAAIVPTVASLKFRATRTMAPSEREDQTSGANQSKRLWNPTPAIIITNLVFGSFSKVMSPMKSIYKLVWKSVGSLAFSAILPVKYLLSLVGLHSSYAIFDHQAWDHGKPLSDKILQGKDLTHNVVVGLMRCESRSPSRSPRNLPPSPLNDARDQQACREDSSLPSDVRPGRITQGDESGISLVIDRVECDLHCTSPSPIQRIESCNSLVFTDRSSGALTNPEYVSDTSSCSGLEFDSPQNYDPEQAANFSNTRVLQWMAQTQPSNQFPPSPRSWTGSPRMSATTRKPEKKTRELSPLNMPTTLQFSEDNHECPENTVLTKTSPRIFDRSDQKRSRHVSSEASKSPFVKRRDTPVYCAPPSRAVEPRQQPDELKSDSSLDIEEMIEHAVRMLGGDAPRLMDITPPWNINVGVEWDDDDAEPVPPFEVAYEAVKRKRREQLIVAPEILGNEEGSPFSELIDLPPTPAQGAEDIKKKEKRNPNARFGRLFDPNVMHLPPDILIERSNHRGRIAQSSIPRSTPPVSRSSTPNFDRENNHPKSGSLIPRSKLLEVTNPHLSTRSRSPISNSGSSHRKRSPVAFPTRALTPEHSSQDERKRALSAATDKNSPYWWRAHLARPSSVASNLSSGSTKAVPTKVDRSPRVVVSGNERSASPGFLKLQDRARRPKVSSLARRGEQGLSARQRALSGSRVSVRFEEGSSSEVGDDGRSREAVSYKRN